MGEGRPIREMSYAIVDLETTGLSRRTDDIIEVAIVHLTGAEHRVVLDTLIRPGKRIGNRAVHGITNRDVRKAPQLEDIAGHIFDALADRVVVAHNARFDMAFLGRVLSRFGHSTAVPSVCTMELHRHLLGQKADLPSACAQLGLSIDGTMHMASVDALAATALFQKHIALLEESGRSRWDDLSGVAPHACAAMNRPPITLRRAADVPGRGPLLPRGAPSAPMSPEIRRRDAPYGHHLAGALDDPDTVDWPRLEAIAAEMPTDELAGQHARHFARWLSLQAGAGTLDHAARLRIRQATATLSRLGWAPGD